MDIRIKTTDYEMTPEVSDYLDERVAHIAKFLGDAEDSARCEVELGKAEGHHKHSDYQWFAEMQLIRPGQERLVAHNHEPSINAAIDNAKDELLQQLRKEKQMHLRQDRKEAGEAKEELREEEEI